MNKILFALIPLCLIICFGVSGETTFHVVLFYPFSFFIVIKMMKGGSTESEYVGGVGGVTRDSRRVFHNLQHGDALLGTCCS